jgi:hypothetical protein
MSAGTGIRHSEYNESKENPVKFLQIWIIPDRRQVQPRYSQVTLNEKDRHNKLQQIVSPDGEEGPVRIYQDAWFHLGKFDGSVSFGYDLKKSGNGVYAFLRSGYAGIGGDQLHPRDAIGIWDSERIEFKAGLQGAEFLLIEVPKLA